MACSDRIDPHLFQNTDLALHCGSMERGTQAAEIMVFAYAMDFQMPAVQEKSFIRIETHGTKSNRDLASVD